MAEHSDIEWTEATWNPITGCTIVSPGCRRCYAMKLAGTRLRNHPSRMGLTTHTDSGPVWNGVVKLNEDWLDQPLKWKRPRKIFVCAHSDLFHPSVPEEWIDHIVARMAIAQHHTYQILTKRPERMCAYFNKLHDEPVQDTIRRICSKWPGRTSVPADGITIPLPNVWLGTSVERQKEADERIPHLLRTLAAVRFISAEPLLGPIDLNRIHEGYDTPEGARVDMWESSLNGKRFDMWAGDDEDPMKPGWPKLDWVIVGGESASDAKPMNPAWVRSIRDQCAAAGTAFLFKQWGSCSPIDGRNIGKKASGRLLDGVEHNGMPICQ